MEDMLVFPEIVKSFFELYKIIGIYDLLWKPVPVFGYSVCEAEFLYVFGGPFLE